MRRDDDRSSLPSVTLKWLKNDNRQNMKWRRKPLVEKPKLSKCGMRRLKKRFLVSGERFQVTNKDDACIM